MGFALGGLLCVCAGLTGGLLGAAALLKLAVVLANRMVGSVPEKAPSRGGIAEWDWDDWDDEEADAAPVGLRRRVQAIPEPGILKCAGVVLVTLFVGGLGFVLLGFAAETLGLRMRMEETQFAIVIVDLPFVFLALTTMLVTTLPVSFWRAGFVSFIYGVLIFALALVLGVVVFVLGTVF
jgi:hypothetical protein